MKQNDKLEWIRDNRCRAWDAIKSLQAAKKTICGEYDERLRKLKAFEEVLFIKQTDDQGELFNPKEVLSPELADLLESPLHGLD